nr:hypothetical protein [Haloferax sp. ATB1]
MNRLVDDEVVAGRGLHRDRGPGHLDAVVGGAKAGVHGQSDVAGHVGDDGARNLLERLDEFAVRSLYVRLYRVHTRPDADDSR